ncbi:MAG: response regulator [Deltaproteobacteria bacterium]|nr:response regulator [Deltaproteobacteria bacterium]
MRSGHLRERHVGGSDTFASASAREDEGRPLNVLVVEAGEVEASGWIRELTRRGFVARAHRIDRRDALLEALEGRERFDLVLCGAGLGANEVLACVRERHAELPFVIVGNQATEDLALEVLRPGAQPPVSASSVSQLVSVVQRQLRDAELRAERTRIKGELLVSERMASIGTLAVGVAHEINNPLAALLGNLQYCAEEVEKIRCDLASASADLAEGSAAKRALDRLAALDEPVRDALEAGERVREIARDLRHFARPEDDPTGAVDLRAVLESSIRMAWNEIRHRARLEKDYAPAPRVRANEGRLGQVFLNLLLNAARAIEVGRVADNEILVRIGETERGEGFVEVRDTGSGIDETVLPRIFDPFFTTKPSFGSGLGLAISARIVAGLGGSITVDSRAGRGSSFRVTLPAAEQDIDGPATRRAKISSTGRAGRILVVDDEPLLGSALRRMLASRHDVTVETDGRAALGRIEHGERFDVILCDLMMPEMDGRAFHEAVRRMAPAQAERFVFMTGGAFTQGAREFLEQADVRSVEKPFDVATIRRIVRELVV